MDRILIGSDPAPACEILIGSGVLTGADPLPANPQRRTVAVVTQPAPARWARSLARALGGTGLEAHVRIVPDREDAKTLAVAGDVYDWLNSLGITRRDTIVGVGGGAVTDLAGFVAATYLRGVECVLVPTTLLGAVDAAIGGKTAVNVRGKNLVGVFRHPRRVLIDTSILEGLPQALRREGAAEAVKAGIVGDPDLVDLYEAQGTDAPVEEVVRRAVAVKAEVVAEDFTEQGRRGILNYGHTVGHAVEVAADISHGEAVAIGMIAAGRASALRLGFGGEERQRSIVESLGLPVTAPPVDASAVRELLWLDKKRDAAGLRMALVSDFGRATVETVDAATVEAALTAVGIG